MPAGSAEQIEIVDRNIFKVPSATDDSHFYEVRADICVCDCLAGIQGRFCKHQVLVQETYGILFPNAPPVTWKERYPLAKLALGSECPEREFFFDGDADPNNIDLSLLDSDNEQVSEPESEAEPPADHVIEQGHSQPMSACPVSSPISAETKCQLKKDLLRELESTFDLIMDDELFTISGAVLLKKLQKNKES